MENENLIEPVRVNTRISSRYNKWLDERSLETSLSKSALINIAIENYIVQTEMVNNIGELLERMEKLEEQLRVYQDEKG